MARPSDGEDALDALFAAPPEAFTATRARTVAALRDAGRTAEAREIARLRRPTLAVWAVNQLARRATPEVRALLALGAGLRAAERRLLRGGGAGELMADARVERQQVAALARRAEALVAAAGRRPTPTLTRKIAQTLHAAAVGDEAARAALAAGRLTRELAPPSGFGALSTASAQARERTPAEREPAAAEREPAAAEREPAAAEREPAAAELEPAAAERKRAAADRQRVVEERQRAADERRRAAVERRRAAEERKRAAEAARAQRRRDAAARKHTARLRRAAAAADREVARQRRAVERARRAVEAAERALRAAKDALADALARAAAAHRAVAGE